MAASPGSSPPAAGRVGCVGGGEDGEDGAGVAAPVVFDEGGASSRTAVVSVMTSGGTGASASSSAARSEKSNSPRAVSGGAASCAGGGGMIYPLYKSAIGHESTAEILTELLGVNVPVNRQNYVQGINDKAIVFKLKTRAPEGVILNREQIEEIGYEFGLLTRTA